MLVQENAVWVADALADPLIIREIDRILRSGHTVELKREGGRLVVVEIRRQMKVKQPL